MRTIIFNGNIYLDKNNFVSAICIDNDIVTSVGDDETILELSNENTTTIDAKGNSVIPGFNDSHIHLYGVGTSLQSVKLYGLKSVDEVIDTARRFIEENNVAPGTFVTGRGWNQDYFIGENRILTRHDLDKISTEHPILFNRACGHMATCNTKALEVCNITQETPQVEGAEFYYDEDGTLNGVFTEHAIDLIENCIPNPSVEEISETLYTAMQYALSQGITSVQTNDINDGNYENMYRAYELVYEKSRALPRTYHQCFFMNPNAYTDFVNKGYSTGYGNEFNKIGPLKMFVDGSLGARTALMREPYADDNSTLGIACMTQEQLDEMVKLADDNNCQVAVHAIGDKAIEMVLDSYDKVIENNNNILRHGIVHCQITDTDLLKRFVKNNVLAYVQPIFIHYDMHIVADRVGEKLASTSYAFGDMLRMGVELSYGTDSPVEDLKTMDNLYCAVARKDLTQNPQGGYYKEQGVSLEDAISLYTHSGAFVSNEENIKGKLDVGYKADLAILDTNIFDMNIENLRDVSVEMTMVGGLVAYQNSSTSESV